MASQTHRLRGLLDPDGGWEAPSLLRPHPGQRSKAPVVQHLQHCLVWSGLLCSDHSEGGCGAAARSWASSKLILFTCLLRSPAISWPWQVSLGTAGAAWPASWLPGWQVGASWLTDCVALVAAVSGYCIVVLIGSSDLLAVSDLLAADLCVCAASWRGGPRGCKFPEASLVFCSSRSEVWRMALICCFPSLMHLELKTGSH